MLTANPTIQPLAANDAGKEKERGASGHGQPTNQPTRPPRCRPSFMPL